MNFKVSDWDNNDLGDKTHSKLFKSNTKSNPELKNKIKNEEIVKSNNLIAKGSETKSYKRNKRRAAEKQKYKILSKKLTLKKPEQKNDLEIQILKTDDLNLKKIEKKKLNNKKRCMKKRQLIKDYKKIAHTLEKNPNIKNVEIIKNFVERKKPEKIVVDIEEKRKKNKLKKELKRLQKNKMKADEILNAKQNKSENTIVETSLNGKKKKIKQNKKINGNTEENIERTHESNKKQLQKEESKNCNEKENSSEKIEKKLENKQKEKSNTTILNKDNGETLQEKKSKKQLKRLQNKQLETAETSLNEIKKKKNKQNKKLNEIIEKNVETSQESNKKQLQNKKLINFNESDNSSEITDTQTPQENNKKTKKQMKNLQNQNSNIQNQQVNGKTTEENNKKLKKQLKRLQNKNMKNVPNKSSSEMEINIDQKKQQNVQKPQENNENIKHQSKHFKNLLKLREKLIKGTETKAISKKSANPLREKMLAKLKAARFRFINEQMYTNESKDSQKLFQQDPAAFNAYHDGYRQQVSKWPLNPLDTIITAIKKMPSDYKIADFGCGDARLAKSVTHKVHSFDLVSNDPKVVACDMAHCPLKKSEVDVVVFCLSLMGTNLKDYLFEANRVLKVGGILKIAEVESRFEGVEQFIDGLVRFGFTNTWKDLSHNLFYFLNFKKERDIINKNKLPTLGLSPCLYKKR